MPRDRTISATKPTFPSYLLPSLGYPFQRRRSESSTISSPGTSPVSSAPTTPENSPPKYQKFTDHSPRIARISPDTVCCKGCSTDLAFSSQIVSKGFTGRYGRAFLVAPPLPPAEQSLLNIRVGRSENRQLVTGMHVVADIMCNMCNMKLGWKYVDAVAPSQKYKVGKFILERERVITRRYWDEVNMPNEDDDQIPQKNKRSTCRRESVGKEGEREEKGGESQEEQEDVTFDSSDEMECDDIFAGIWDPEVTAMRRRRREAKKDTAYEVDYDSD